MCKPSRWPTGDIRKHEEVTLARVFGVDANPVPQEEKSTEKEKELVAA